MLRQASIVQSCGRAGAFLAYARTKDSRVHKLVHILERDELRLAAVEVRQLLLKARVRPMLILLESSHYTLAIRCVSHFSK